MTSLQRAGPTPSLSDGRRLFGQLETIRRRVKKYLHCLTSAMFRKKDKKSPKDGKSPKDKTNETPDPLMVSSGSPPMPTTPLSSSQTKKVGRVPPPIPSPSDFPTSRNPSGSNTPKRGVENPVTPSRRPSMAPSNGSDPVMPSESSEARRKRLRKPSFPSFGRSTTSSGRDTPNMPMPMPTSLGSPPSKDLTLLARSTPGGLRSLSTTHVTDRSMTYVTDLTAAYDREFISNAHNSSRVAQAPSLGSVTGSRPGGGLPLLGRTPSGRFKLPTLSDPANVDAGDRSLFPPIDYNLFPPKDYIHIPPKRSVSTSRDNLPPRGSAKPVARSAGRVKVRSNDSTPEDLLYIPRPLPTPGPSRPPIPRYRTTRDTLPPPDFAKPADHPVSRVKVRSTDVTLENSVPPSLSRVAAGPSSHATAISGPSVVSPPPRRTFTIHNPETPTSSRSPSAVHDPARVVSRITSSQFHTTSAHKKNTKIGNTRSLASPIFNPSQEAEFNECEELAMERPKTPDLKASPGRQETRGVSRSPPLVLSVIPSEGNFDPNAPPPGLYTVTELMNLLIEKNIKLTKDGDPVLVNVGDWKLEIAGAQVHDAKLPEASSKISNKKDLIDSAMDFVRTEMAKRKAAKEERSRAEQQNFDHGHLDKKPYPARKEILASEEAKGPSGQRFLHVQGLNINLDGTPMSDEQMETLWDEMERERKANGGKLPEVENSWANEDRQTPSSGERIVKAINERNMEIPERQTTLARVRADSDKSWDMAVINLGRTVTRIRANRTAAAKAAIMKPTHHLLDMPANIMVCIMRELLVVAPEEEVVPYHYVAGKVIKNADGGRWGLRTKPQVNILVALCATKHKKVRLALDTGRNVLYRENQFAFRKPAELILFMSTIGWTNIARMDFDTNLVVSMYFLTKYTHSPEVKWLARWQAELKSAMQGRELITPDWKPEDSDDEYQPPEIEKALKTMANIVKGIGDMGTPRIRTLDFGDDFSLIGEMLQYQGIEDTQKGKGKAKAEAETVEGNDPQIDWNDWKLDRASGAEDYFVSFYRAENGDARSETSGFHTPTLNNYHFLDEEGDPYGVSEDEQVDVEGEEVDDEEEGEGDGEGDEEDNISIASENDTLDREIKALMANER
ncbi:hypothetical protein N7G274_001034 [Stereocaulon virgatum]|uniref:Uncharacterized protein n=1 Tax=Stereocaulon virgatum TaxID=373712 RepID=A0ABR4AQA2_9LECA